MIFFTLGMNFFSIFLNANPILRVVQEQLDVIVGCIAILAFVADCILNSYINRQLDISNELRELYDCKVVGIKPNDFFCKSDKDEIKKHLAKAEYVQDRDKYEVWYREIFCEDDFANAICVMMDNVIYTYRVYDAYVKIIARNIAAISIVFLLYTCFFFWAEVANQIILVSPFILFIAVFDEIKELITSFMTAKELAGDNEKLYLYVLKNAEEFKHYDENEKERVIRNLEDVILTNRSKSLFIPAKVRYQFLDNNCIYYQDLDKIKCAYMGDQVCKPEVSKDFEICAAVKTADEELTTEEECQVVNMEQIHEELLGMLIDVKKVLDEGHIQFMLDGGTLIGSIRAGNEQKFLAWDDDIDISIHTRDVKTAMSLIREKLGDKYELQDYESEDYYSPRLSRFRIRQKNEISYIDEKDSELYELYEHRGLFIDVYAYTPILYNRFMDGWYRIIFIHTMHKKIRKVESKWKHNEHNAQDKCLKKFSKLKDKYMERSNWYLEHAKCEKYYCYEPHYLDNLKYPGPYIPAEDLYGKSGEEYQNCWLEGLEFCAPAVPENVLRAFYGENWNRSPFVSIKELKKKQDSQFANILVNRKVDYLYKLFFAYPITKKIGKYKTKRKVKNEYSLYTGQINKLEKKLQTRNKWYLDHARCDTYVSYPPEKINKQRLKIYYSRERIEEDTKAYDFDAHLYTKSDFDATLYKHVKRVNIVGKAYPVEE